MAVIDDLGQKIKGKGQKLRGRMRPDPIRGAVDQTKGTVNETAADMKLNARKPRDTDIDDTREGI